MSYFRELPDLEYQSFLKDSHSSQNYLRVKNLFRRCKLREDLENIFTYFYKYEIEEGQRPDTIANEVYGSSDLDWVVLISAGIINLKDQWPLSNNELYQYADNLYGTKLNEVRFYETIEIKDSKGRLILPEGKIVDYDFKISYFDGTTIEKTLTNARRGITNLQYEVRKNNEKRTINLLRSNYLQAFLNDMKEEMMYSRSSQYVTEKLARTENTRITLP